MITHLSAEEIKDYVGRRALRQEAARIDEHLFSCAACYQRLLHVLQAQRRFPIEIDLSDLAGLRGWHLQGEELKAYVAGQMDELDRVYARLHLKECAWCREEVTHFSEFTSKLEFYLSRRHAPLKPLPVRSKFFDRLGTVPTAWSPARLASAAALVLLLISATWLWSVRETNHQSKETTLSAQSQESGSPLAGGPSTAQATSSAQPAQPRSSDASSHTNQKLNLKHKLARSSWPASATQLSLTGKKREKAWQDSEASRVADNLAMPAIIESFDRTPVVLRGDDDKSAFFRVTSPYSTVISTDQPTFRWTALGGASSYVISVYDANLNLIATSTPLTETEWMAPAQLTRGEVYTWIVTALKDGKEILAPTLPARAEFKIIKRSELLRLNRRIEQIHSGVVRGVLYAKAGLLDEAERELQNHLALYPADEQARELLQTIKSWRKP